MSPGVPYLESGESIVLTTDRISVDALVFEALLTSRRLILFDSRSIRSEPRITLLDRVRSVRSGRAASGEPVVILTLAGNGSAEEDLALIFLQEPLENRRSDRDLWLKSCIELSVSTREPVAPARDPAGGAPAGMRPSVRRWVAPDIVRPKTDNFPGQEPVPVLKIREEEIPEARPIHEPAEPVTLRDTSDLPHSATVTMQIPDSFPEGLEIKRGVPQEAGSPGLAGSTAEEPTPLSVSILAATRSLITARAREELALPPRPVRVRTTSSLPDLPPPRAAPVVNPEPHGNGPVPIPVPDNSEEAPVIPEPVTAPEPTDTLPPAPETIDETGTIAGRREEGADSSPPPALPAVPALKYAPSPQHTQGSAGPILAAGGILLCLLGIVTVFILMSGAGSAPDHQQSVVLPTPLATLSPTMPPTAGPTTVDLMGKGVWVRISSEAEYAGQAGSIGYLQPVTGPGTKGVQIQDLTKPVRVIVGKLDNTGHPLTVTILRNGETITSRSVSAPMGEIEILIDPLTGYPPGFVPSTPAINVTRVGGNGLEYY